MTGPGWDRREFIRAAALLGAALGTPGCVTTAALDPSAAPTDRQLAMLREASQIVIPRTDTPGAGDAGVGEFVALALAHGLEDSRAPLSPQGREFAPPAMLRADGALRYVDWLEGALAAGWLEADEAARASRLAALDAAAFAPAAAAHPWRKLKALILTGYYTSQAGGAQELHYSAVPGRFDPAVPVTPETRGLSSDWTGVEFG